MHLQFLSEHQERRSDVMSSGIVFQSLGPATANDRSLTVTSHDRGMTSSHEVDDRRRHLDVIAETQCSRSDRYQGAVPHTARYTVGVSLYSIQSLMWTNSTWIYLHWTVWRWTFTRRQEMLLHPQNTTNVRWMRKYTVKPHMAIQLHIFTKII